MDASPENSSPPRAGPSPLLRRLDQATIAFLLAVSLLLMVIAAFSRQRQGQGLIEIDRAEPLAIDWRVDINRADWPELALLPDVGETLARRMVEFRQQNGPFLDERDLLRVPGIGPRKLEGIRPYLLPLPGIHDFASKGGKSLNRPDARSLE